MASDLSSGCTEVIEIFDEKEEGEISLEDVSSSEEGQLNDRSGSRRRNVGQCATCLARKHCASWCTASALLRTSLTSKISMKKDAVQEKENYHNTKDSGHSGSRHPASTLQESNSDLIPISSDSDMEIVGLADSVKQVQATPQTKVTKNRKRKKRRRPQNNLSTVENSPVIPPLNSIAPACSTVQKRDSQVLKDNHLPRAHRKESNSPHKRSGSPFSRGRIAKSPLRRHRSPIARAKSNFTKSRSPPGHPRSPVLQKLPVRRPRSPVRKLPPRSPSRSPAKRLPRSSVSPSNTYIDMYGNVSKLLKKVRHLKGVGSQSTSRNAGKHKGHGASLKEKLSNMMKGDNGSVDSSKLNNEKKSSAEEIDDEEDLALLRKMALETKPKKSETEQENKELKETVTQCENNNVGDDDIEDLELRMIALRSAMLKKHQDRQQRGVITGKMKKPILPARKNTESPFSQSFLDSMPILNYENGEIKTPPSTPDQVLNESTNPEDMELDSEVELEKEKEAEPYSPTDEISRQIIMDTELLGIQPSDVSFITPSSQNTVTSNTSGFQNLQSSKIVDVLETGASYLSADQIIANNFLSSDIAYYSTTNVLPSSQSPTSSANSIINPTELLEPSQSNNLEENLPTAPYSPSQPIETPEMYFPSQDDPYLNSDLSQIPEPPYSPTDTPIYDLELNSTPLLFDVPPFQISDTISKPAETLSSDKMKKKRRKSKLQSSLIKIDLIPKLLEDIGKASSTNIPDNSENTLSSSLFYPERKVDFEKDFASETSSMKADVGSALDSPENSPDSTMVTVDELPETDLDGSPLVPVPKELCDIEIHIPASITKELMKIAQEPLYLQGVPDVTKDFNKIPTLVNRSLVPASILKSNKNLQQPLPQKKIEQHLEPAFKSAEMQPVEISEEVTNTNRLFKPIKLAPVVKKRQIRMVTPAAFNCSSNDNSVLEQEDPENNKSAHGMCMNETRNLLKGSQSENEVQTFARKTWEMVNAVLELGNSSRISQSPKTLPLSGSEQKPKSFDDHGKNTEDNLDKRKKRPSRRSRSAKKRSKHTNKSSKDDKCDETKDKTTDAAKTTIDRVAGEEISSSSKHTQNLNKQDKNYDAGRSASKNRNSLEKSKKIILEKSKKDRDKRAKIQPVAEIENQWRSRHKHDKSSNKNKNTDSNKDEEDRSEAKKQSCKTTEIEKNNDHAIRSVRNSAERREISESKDNFFHVEKTNNNTTSPQLRGVTNDYKNISGNEKVNNNTITGVNERKSSGSSGTNVNIPNSSVLCSVTSKPAENFASASESRTQDSEDSMSDNTSCKRVEANKRRRSSLDEDEEALRASLLASLAKRSKPTESFSTTTKTSSVVNLSNSLGNKNVDSVEELSTASSTKVSVNSTYNLSSDNTPALLDPNNSNLSDPIGEKLTAENLAQSSTATVDKITLSEKANNSQTMVSTVPSRKRSISTNAKAPLKKIAKKTPISASVRVVNNAKKYQNTLVQKKLNLQKIMTISNAQKALSHMSLHNKKIIDGSRPKSMITQPLSDTQRFVINLASDSESDNEMELQYKNLNKPVNNSLSEQNPGLTIPMSDFEKSVDLLLKEVRTKQETAAAVKPSLTKKTVIQKPASPVASASGKSTTLSTTPSAVRHLPVSLQEEYRRLKQQILEREKLKLHRTLVNNNSPSSPSSKSGGTPPGPLSPAGQIISSTNSKQNNNIPSHSQSQITAAANKASGARSVSIQSNVKTRVSVGEVTGGITPIANLSIKIPNELTKVDSSSRNSINSYIPVSNSQSRVVTAVKITQETTNIKDSTDSAVTVKNQFNVKTVQVQLQQGKTGRTVSLNETVNLGRKAPISKNRVVEAVEAAAQESVAVKNPAKVNSANRADQNLPTHFASSLNSEVPKKTVDAIDVHETCNNSVDSAASTLIITREEDKSENSCVAESLASTVIISRNEENDSSRLGPVNSENGEACSLVPEPLDTRPAKSKNNKGTWEKIRDDVGKELDAISALPSGEQKSYLTNIEQNLVKKRYAILDDLSEISGNLRQLEMEREVQSNMALEVKKLQEQLKLAEERLQAQRSRVNQMAPNITAAYEKFNNGRRECVKMTKICLGLGCLVIGANYKIPAAGAQLLNKRMKQVAGCTRELSQKKASATDNVNTNPECTELPSQISGLENCVNFSQSESMPSTILGESTKEDNESVTANSVTVRNDRNNSESEPGAREEAERIADTTEEDTLTFDDSRTRAKSVPKVLPQQLTSTPNSSKESSSVPEHVEDSEAIASTFVLDSPRAGFSGQNDSLEECRYLQPYRSVLAHLNVPRTTDPNGILCPYELMGTCRDEDCNFVHQSARNGRFQWVCLPKFQIIFRRRCRVCRGRVQPIVCCGDTSRW